VNKFVLKYISALVGFLRKLVISVHGYEQKYLPNQISILPNLIYI